MINRKEDQRQIDVGKVVLTIFGGAGLCMILGSIFLFIDEEIGGAVGLFLFGSIFCVAGYGASRVLRIPKGKKRVLISERFQQFRSVRGQSGQRKSQQYFYVDENVPDSEVKGMQTEWSEKPWTQRKDWAEGKVIQEGAQSLGLLIGFTILWNAISWGITGIFFISEGGAGGASFFILIFNHILIMRNAFTNPLPEVLYHPCIREPEPQTSPAPSGRYTSGAGFRLQSCGY